MAVVIFGEASANIAMEEMYIRCPACESHQFADVMVKSSYYHFYYVPIFPTGKQADIICSKCGLKRYGVPFDEPTIANDPAIRRKFRHPLFTYTGAIILCLVVAGILVSALMS